MTPTIVPLPTADDFAALPLADRTRVFADWLRAQPREITYHWYSVTECALGRFSQAIFRDDRAEGGASLIAKANDEAITLVFSQRTEMSRGMTNALRLNTTFGAASDAFDAAMKLEELIP